MSNTGMPPKTSVAARAIRECHAMLNSLHSTVYFTGLLERQLAVHGVEDPMAAYLAGRAAALGRVEAGVVSALFYSFHPEMVAAHIPSTWLVVSPEAVLRQRFDAVDATLRGFMSDEELVSARVVEAVDLASALARSGERAGRAMYSAHADINGCDSAHQALWSAATKMREHRGDSHIIALRSAGLDGLEALVTHCASPEGMPPVFVREKRGWSVADWAGAERRLAERGILDSHGRLTDSGSLLRAALEDETDRLDRVPYDTVGPEAVTRLTSLVSVWVRAAGAAGVFPAPLSHLFAAKPGDA